MTLKTEKNIQQKKHLHLYNFQNVDSIYEEACEYASINFSNNIGQLSKQSLYPTHFKTSKQWFQEFLEQRFLEFGTYEDAIVANQSILNHSVLTPMLNIGLLVPKDIIKESIAFAEINKYPH